MQNSERSTRSSRKPIPMQMTSPGPESDTGQYMCIECSETFDTKLELTSHRQSHVAKKQFTCTHCGRGFHHQVFLQMHERSHEEGVSRVKTPPPRVISTRSSKMADIVHVKPTYTKPPRPLNSIVHFKTETKVYQTFTPKEFLTRRCHGSGVATSQKDDVPEKKNLFELRISKFSDTTVHLMDSFGNSIEILTDVFNAYTIAGPEENGVTTNADEVPTKTASPDETNSKTLTEETSPQTKPADMANDRPPSSEPIASESVASEKPEAGLPLPELSNAESAVAPEQEPMESRPSSETMENVSEKQSVQPSEVSQEKVDQGQAVDSIIDGNLPAIDDDDDMDTTPEEEAASPASPQKQQNELEVNQTAKHNSTLLTDEPIAKDKRLEEDSPQLPDCSSLGDPGSSKDEPKTIKENKQPEEEMIPNVEQAQDLTLPKSDAEVGKVNPPEEMPPERRENLSPAMPVNVSEDRPAPLEIQSSKEEADLSNTLSRNRDDVSSPTEDASVETSAEDLGAQNEQSTSSEERSVVGTIIPEKHDLQSATVQVTADKNLKTDICMTSEDVGQVSIPEEEVGLPEKDLPADNKEPEKPCSLLSGQDMLHDDDDDDDDDNDDNVDDDDDNELVIDDKRDQDLFERDIFPLEVCEKGLASVEEQNIVCGGEARSTKIVQEKESDICLNGSEMTYISESEMIKLLDQDKDDIAEDEPIAAGQKDLETMKDDDQALSQSKLEPELSNSEETKSSRSPETVNEGQNTVDEMLTNRGSELPASLEEETSEVQLGQNKLKTTDHVGLPSENHNLPTFQAPPPNEKMETSSCSPLSFLTNDEPRTGEAPDSIESMITQDSVSKNSSEERLAPSSGHFQPITAEGMADLPQPEQDLPCRDKDYEPSGTSTEKQDVNPVGDAAMSRTERTHDAITPEEMDVCVTVEDNECDDEQTDSLEGPSQKDAVIQSGQEKPHTGIPGHSGLVCSIEPEQSKTKVGEIESLPSKQKDVIDPEPLAKHGAETNEMICNKERKSKLKIVDQESKNPPLDVLDDKQITSNDGDHAKAKSPERDLKDERMQDKQVDQDAAFPLKENEKDDAETDKCTQEQTTDLSSNLDSSSKTVSTNEIVESKKSSLDKKLFPKGDEDHELGELPTGALEDNSLPKDMEDDSEKISVASPKDIESEVMDDCGSATKEVSDVASSIGQTVGKDSLQDALEDSELMENDQEDADNAETPSKSPGVGGECLKCGRRIRRGRREMVRLPVCFKCRKAAKKQERLSNQETADGVDLDPLKSKRALSLSAELADSPIKQDGDPLILDPLVDEKEASRSAAKKRYKCPKCDETFRIPSLLAGHIKCHTLPQCLTCRCPMQLKYKTKRIPKRCQKCVQQLKEKRAEKKVVEGSGDEYSATSDDEDADINPDNDVSDEDSKVGPLDDDEEVDSFKKDKEKSKKQEIESDDELDTSDQNLDLPDSVKPRLCPQCGKAFRCNRSLNLHLLSHTSEQCESCGCRLSKRRKVGRWSKKCRSCRLQIKGKLLTDSGDELSLSGDKLPKQKNVASLRLKAKQTKMSKNSKIQSIIKKKKELKWMNMLLAVRGLMDKSKKKKESALKAAELAKKDGESSETEKCAASSVESSSIHPDDPKSDLNDPDMEKAGSSELLSPLIKTPKQGRKCLYKEKNIIKVEESEVLPYIPDSTFIKQEETWQCVECNQTWPNSEALVNHQHSHTTGQSFTCPQCPQVFSTEQYLDLHVHSHEEDDRRYRCPECDKTFTKRNNLGVHMRVHAGSRPYMCPDCPRRFRQKVTLLAHRYSHRNYELLFTKPFQCSVCSKSFKMKERLVVHERLHTGECPFSCKDCDKAFPSKARLYAHRKMHRISQDPSSSEQNLSKDISEGQPFKCQDCGKVCSTKASFVLHRKIHRLSSMPVKIIKRERSEEEHPFGCKECNKVFSSKGNLKIHLKNHSAHKATAKSEMSPEPKGCFPCKDCDKVCSTKASFALHRKVHKSPSDGEPNPIIKVESDTPGYVCNYCNKVCSTKASLVLHRRVHKTPGSADSETKSFKCKDCDMVFFTKVSYFLHRKVHRSASKSQKSPKAGAEPQSYNCKHCEMVCSTKASFVLHSRVHKTPTTSEQNLKVDELQSYNCKHCDMVCSTKASFILHSKVHRSLDEQSPKGVEEPQLYNCKYCDVVCSTKASFILHSKGHRSLVEGEQSLKTSEEPQLYNCKHCDMVCSTKASFVLHSKVHRSLVGEQSPKVEGLKSFRCKKCDMVCSTKASFVLHSKVHKSGQNLQANTEKKHFTCKVCKKVCLSKASFILHRKVHKSSSSENNPTPKADGEESTFPCKDCAKVYASKGRLAFHIKKVHGDSSSPDQSANNESNAEQPKMTEEEEKPFPCAVCELRFAKLIMLVRHRVVHEDRTITPCMHCGKRFLYMKSLSNHMKICQSKGKGKKLLLLKKAVAKRKIPKDTASTSSDGESVQKKRKVDEKQKALKAAQKLKTKNLAVKAKKAAAAVGKEKGKGKGPKEKRAKVDGEGASEGEGKKTTTEKQSDGKEEEKPSEQTAKEPTPKKKSVTKVNKTKKEPAKEKAQKVGGPKKWRVLAASTIKKKAIIIGGKKKVLIKKKVQMKPKSGAKAAKD
ncbi:uncharacterized protein LOC120941764 [Rana temporaria]|uniref:uncharacterized protein LOC120941764 n=1 Tax=Rana temporaria TaxID=8407 RepID=UPI001AADE58D|nr:uncharacterized protein LOC120941764 [Rana temporaria]